MTYEPIATVELVPGEVFATVLECPLPIGGAGGSVARAWAYVTSGFGGPEHPEVVVVLRNAAGRAAEDYDEVPLLLLRQLHGMVAEGHVVEPYACTMLSVPTGFGGASVGGFLYTGIPDWTLLPWADPGGFELEPVLVVPLFEEELRAAQRFGAARVLALLGAQSRTFPYPHWFDPGRGAVLQYDRYAAATVLSGAGVLVTPEIEVVRDGELFEVRYGQDTAEWLHDMLRSAPPTMALLPRVPCTPAIATWQPGQQGPMGISANAPGSTELGLNFVMLSHGPVAPVARMIEDGFGLVVGDQAWQQLLYVIGEGQQLTMRLGRTAVRFAPV